eukprot:m.197907 g.197907  ORF g.197907 m.197907 type:complete len:564 (+) comp20269_c0_seq1:213-1904(+)
MRSVAARGSLVGGVMWTTWAGLILLSLLGWFVGRGTLQVLKGEPGNTHLYRNAADHYAHTDNRRIDSIRTDMEPAVNTVSATSILQETASMGRLDVGASSVQTHDEAADSVEAVHKASSEGGATDMSAATVGHGPRKGSVDSHSTMVGSCCQSSSEAGTTHTDVLPLPSSTSPHCRFMLPSSVLLHNPPRVRGQLEPCLAVDVCLDTSNNDADSNNAPRLLPPETQPVVSHGNHGNQNNRLDYSIIINVYNHEATIERVLLNVLKLTAGNRYEIILFFDGCTDDSLENVRRLLARYLGGWDLCRSPTRMSDPTIECRVLPQGASTVWMPQRIRLIVQPANNSVYETSANNIAMRAATGRYLVLMQDDMYLSEAGWNERLGAAPQQYDDIVSVSAMCAHTLHPLGQDKVGPCGRMASFAKTATQKGKAAASLHLASHITIRPTSNRGPLLLDADKVKSLGYLDEWNYHMMNDDHDFHCRAALDRQWVTGFVSVGFHTNVAEGGVRVNRKRTKPAYERHFIAARKKRYNKKDCFRARKKEYIRAVQNGSVVVSGERPLRKYATPS